MRILHISSHGVVGGLETFGLGLYRGLEAVGHTNVVLAIGSRVQGIERRNRHVTWCPSPIDRTAASESALRAHLTELLDQMRPDLACVHTAISSTTAAKILGQMPTVYFAHEYGHICPAGALLYQRTNSICKLRGTPDWRCLANAYVERCNTRRPAALLRSFARARDLRQWTHKADAIICGSTYVAERCLENGFPIDRVHVLPYPMSIDAGKHELNETREPILLYVGRVTPQKGVDYLIRAFRNVPEPARLMIVGDGYDLPRIRALAARLELAGRVEFRPDLVGAAAHAAYRHATALVVPSVWPEPFGLVGPEAMAAGTPVIASRVGGISEWLIDGETGILVEPRDVDALTGAMRSLIDDPTLARRMGACARATALERFTLEGYVAPLVSLFDHLRGPHNGPGSER